MLFFVFLVRRYCCWPARRLVTVANNVLFNTLSLYYIGYLVFDCAGGGEYDVQLGFGWTNGVILDFLHIYGDRLVTEQPRNS